MPPYISAVRADRQRGGGHLSFYLEEPTGNIIPEPLIRAQFFEDPGALIPAKRYTGCSATRMSTPPRHKAVFIPDEQTGRSGIFIHRGSHPDHSDGCLVCDNSVLDFIHQHVASDGRDIVVELVELPSPVNDWNVE